MEERLFCTESNYVFNDLNERIVGSVGKLSLQSTQNHNIITKKILGDVQQHFLYVHSKEQSIRRVKVVLKKVT